MRIRRYELDAYRVYLFMSTTFALALSLFFTVVFVYFATDVTDDPFQLVLIGTSFQVTLILFEIPTGVVADVYSRRLSIWIGLAIIGIGNLIEGFLPIYGLVVVAEIVSAIGITFISGATDAWIADEIGEERVSQAYLRATQLRQIVWLAGIPISTGLATISLSIPVIVSGVLCLVLAAVLVVIMPENGFQRKPPEERDSWRTLFKTFGDGVRLVRGRTVLLMILLIILVYGVSDTGFDSLWTVNMLKNIQFPAFGAFEVVVWFGLIEGAARIAALVGTELVRRKMNTNDQAVIVRVLIWFTGATALSMVVFGLSGVFWLAALAYLVQSVLRVMSKPILRIWITHNVESHVRATVFSINAQASSLGGIAGGPLLGVVGSTISLPIALISSGLARIPVALLFARLMVTGRKVKQETVATD